MKKFSFSFLLILLFIIGYGQESRELDYIRTHAKLAVEEMHLYKIPASITLAQGMIETGGGQSRLANEGRNHFGIKCKENWTGETISHTDDAPNECFRVYNSVQESYRDHSLFLAERPYYKDLFKLDLLDYNGWAHGLRKAGYATNKRYPAMLLSRIDKYDLSRFDRLTPEEVDAKILEFYGHTEIVALTNYPPVEIDEAMEQTIAEVIAAVGDYPDSESSTSGAGVAYTEDPIKKIKVEKRPLKPSQRIKTHKNGVKFIHAEEGETLFSIAQLYDMSPQKLAAFNELPDTGTLTEGQPVFFNKKKNKGSSKTYKVQEGDNMYLISQKAGIRLSKLYHLNRMKAGEQPKVGTVLNLKKRKKA